MTENKYLTKHLHQIVVWIKKINIMSSMIQDAIEMGLDPVIAPDHRLWEESSCTQSALSKELWGDLQDDYKIDTTQGETSEMEQKEFKTGSIVMLNSNNIKMTVQDTLDHNICICRWLDKKGNLKSEEFDRCEVSLYKSYIIPDDVNNEDDKISLEEFLTFPTEDDAGASGMDNVPF